MLLPSPSLYRALPHSFSGSQPTYAWKWVGISRKSVAAQSPPLHIFPAKAPPRDEDITDLTRYGRERERVRRRAAEEGGDVIGTWMRMKWSRVRESPFLFQLIAAYYDHSRVGISRGAAAAAASRMRSRSATAGRSVMCIKSSFVAAHRESSSSSSSSSPRCGLARVMGRTRARAPRYSSCSSSSSS